MQPVMPNSYAAASNNDRSGRLLASRVFPRLDPRPAAEWVWPRRRQPTLRLA